MLNEHLDKESLTREHDIWHPMKQVDFLRSALRGEISSEEKSAFGQFFTPYPVAELMSSMFTWQAPDIRILDAGAGIGSLFTAAVTHFCQKEKPPRHISVTAYEIDDILIEHLDRAMHGCKEMCSEYGVEFTGIVKHG